MRKYLFIISKLVKIQFRKFFFISFINFFTIFCTTLSVAFIILVFSVNSTFKKYIQNSIIKNDGFLTIYKKDYKNITLNDYDRLLNEFKQKYIISRLNTHEVIIRNGNNSSVSNLRCVDFNTSDIENESNKVFNLESTLIEGEIKNNNIIVGSKLAKNLNIDCNDIVNVIYKKKSSDLNFHIFKIKVSGIIETNIPDFDNYISYIDIDDSNKIFDFNSKYESVVLSPININNSSSVINQLADERILLKYNKLFWKEKYSYFLNWLSVYDAPINILLFFIVIIAIINICSSAYIDNNYRLNEILMLNKIGLNRLDIINLFNIKSVILTMLGSILGFISVYTLSIINEKYILYELPSEIYYMNKIPLEIEYFFAFIFIFLMITVSSAINYLTISNLLKNKNISL